MRPRKRASDRRSRSISCSATPAEHAELAAAAQRESARNGRPVSVAQWTVLAALRAARDEAALAEPAAERRHRD